MVLRSVRLRAAYEALISDENYQQLEPYREARVSALLNQRSHAYIRVIHRVRNIPQGKTGARA